MGASSEKHEFVPHLAAIEWATGPRKELMAHPSTPRCLFKDIMEFVREEYRSLSGRELMDLLFVLDLNNFYF